MTERDLALRAKIMRGFAETGGPPDLGPEDGPALRALAAAHVVVLDHTDRILMAHPFAAHERGARVAAAGQTWWGNCAWDGLGIVAALGLEQATVTAQGIELRVRDGEVSDDAVFHVAVPARHWWDDVEHT